MYALAVLDGVVQGCIWRHRGLLHKIIEERMKCKSTRGTRKLQLLHDLTIDDGYAHSSEQLKKGKEWRYSGMMSRT